MLLPLCFGFCLLFQRHVPAKAVAPPYAGLGGAGAPAHGTVPSPLPSLGRMDLMRILWPLCARRHSVIYTCCSN